MMEMQEKSQADFDIEKMFELLDTALTSKDERVQNAFRALLTIIALTKPQDDGKYAVESSHGPLRQMQQDLRDLERRVWSLREQVDQMTRGGGGGNNPWVQPAPYGGGLPAQPYTNPGSPYGPTWAGTNPNGAEWTVK